MRDPRFEKKTEGYVGGVGYVNAVVKWPFERGGFGYLFSRSVVVGVVVGLLFGVSGEYFSATGRQESPSRCFPSVWGSRE